MGESLVIAPTFIISLDVELLWGAVLHPNFMLLVNLVPDVLRVSTRPLRLYYRDKLGTGARTHKS